MIFRQLLQSTTCEEGVVFATGDKNGKMYFYFREKTRRHGMTLR